MEPNTLLVHVEGARGLYLKNHVTLDAYATVVLHGKGSMRSRAITEVVNTDGDCRWDEHCEFKVTDKSTHITVTVQSKTKFGGAEVIGKCEVPIDQAKKVGGHMWFALKKKRDDSKYRGEIQLQFTFTYEKPSLSVSNTSLNKIEKDGMLDKMKRKIKLVGGKHKQAEDTMSVTSGVSSASMTSSRSTRFMSRLNRTISKKLSSLQDGHTIFSQNDTNSSLESNGHLAPPVPNGNAVVYREGKQSNVSRPSSTISGIDFNEDPSYTQSNRLSTPISNGGQFTQNVGGSPTKQRNDDLAYSQQDLLALVDSLRLELRVKDSRLRDMEEYMDNLISRVMERNPELLAAPLAPDKPKRRYF